MSYLYPSALPSYRTPVSQNPREKYLAALAEAKAAEAEYLAAERLQREEDELRQRLEQIQSLKHQSTTSPAYFTQQQYSQAAPTYHQTAPLDLDAFRRQIAAEERARIVREQEQARELEAIRAHEVHNAQLEAQRKARELEAIRVHEVRKAQQAARDQERARALVAQRTELEGLTRRALNNTVRVVVGEDAVPRRQHCRPQRAAYPEFRNTVDLTPLLVAAGKRQHQQAHEHNACNCAPKKETNELEDVFAQLFGGRVAVEAQQQPKQQPKKAPAPAQAVDLGQLFQHVLGGVPVPAAPQPKPKAEPKPQQAPQQAPVTLEQLLNHFLGAAGIEVEVEQPKASTSGAPKASASSSSQAQPSEKKEAAPAPQSAPAPAPASKPTPTPAPAAQPQHGGLEHILNHFLGAHPSAAAPNQHQVDLQQLMNMFLGGAAPHAQPEASSSKSSSESAPASKPAPTESVAQREARELEEAIRMSLAESHSTANTTTESGKGKAPAPAPVKDVVSSTAEVHAIDAEFNARSSEFVFPPTLDFSTSRTSSPSRALTGTTGDESAVARLSYSATNQPVRYYHQALSGLLARLDAVDSFGDEGLRHTRKEVVGRVEGALDEVEKVVDARWRKFTGKAERSESAPIALPVESEAQPAPTVAEESPVAEEAPVVVTAEDVAPVELVAEAVPEATTTPAVPEPAPEVESSYPPVSDSESSYPPVTESSSYPPSVAESVETLRPAASPAPSDIDTFLLPATTDEQPVKKPRVKDDVEEVGSDWSEVDA